MKNKKTCDFRGENTILENAVIDKIRLLFIGIIIYFSSLHKAFTGNRGWLTLSGSMVSVSVISPWFTDPSSEIWLILS